MKKHLKSDGQQFHQYKKNKQLPLTWTQKKTTAYGVRNPGPGFKTCLNNATGKTGYWNPNPSHSDNSISMDSTDINKQYKKT